MRKRFNKKARENNSLPPIPTSCNAAAKLLNEKAHVNLVDYLAARQAPRLQGQEDNYAKLLFGSRNGVVKYTKKTKKYMTREDAKEEWLQPLMRTMAFR
jgi:hypothetical protein